MLPKEFHSAVARATGESLGVIRRRGFSPVASDLVDSDVKRRFHDSSSLDWDELEQAHRVSVFPQHRSGRYT